MPVEVDPNERLYQIMAVSGAAAFMGMIGFLSSTLARVKKLDYRRLVGGAMFAAFTSGTASMLMMGTGMDPLYSAPLAAMLGSLGEKGFNWILEKHLGTHPEP